MICPNCGHTLSDRTTKCPSCGAIVHAFRRRRTNERTEETENLRIRKQTQPTPQEERREPVESMGSKPKTEIPGQKESPKKDASRAKRGSNDSSEYRSNASIPEHIRRSEEYRHSEIRYVRHAPKQVQKKVNGKPVMSHPPIAKKTHKRLGFVLIAIFVFLLSAFSTGAYLLISTESGQQMMAEWGWSIARTDAYITLGKQLMEQAYYTQSLEKLTVAREREPRNVDTLLYIAQDYMALGREDEAVEIYESLINDIAPQHPSAYRALIEIYQKKGYYSESLLLMKQASENTTGTQEFDIMLRSYTPTAPSFSHLEGRYNNEIDVVITIPEGEVVYYTTDGTDPSESGLVYTKGTKIHIFEGKLTLKAIGFTENGMPSEQVTANYTVIIPTPAAPKANYASGVYKNAPKVSLRPGDEDEKKNRNIVAIYYTLDGRQATTDSTLYNPDEPIQIPVGDSTLRAISVDKNGKVSYEMRVTYKVEGNLKRMFTDENDSFKNLSLYKTTYSTFVKSWGTPASYEPLPQEQWYDEKMETYEAVYSWGKAWFAVKTSGKDPVLVMLDTSNEKMSGPRSTKVGMTASQVMDKFRDLGHPALDEYNNRLLYNWNSANVQFGTYRHESDGSYAIHYFDPVDEKQTIFVELTYYLDADGGKVTHILWRRYLISRR